MVVYHCGMETDCMNNEKLIAVVDTPLGPVAAFEKQGVHPTYDDAQKCVHSKDPANWKKLNPR